MTATDEEKTQVKNYKTLLDAEEAFRNLSSSVDWRTAYRETGTKLLDLVLQGKWTTGSVGGEWVMLGLFAEARAALWRRREEEYVKALGVCKGNVNAMAKIKRNGDAEIHRERACGRWQCRRSAMTQGAFAGHDLVSQRWRIPRGSRNRGNNASAFALPGDERDGVSCGR